MTKYKTVSAFDHYEGIALKWAKDRERRGKLERFSFSYYAKRFFNLLLD
jgi:hypothetical protein